jgi:hypothetical protein
MYISLYHKNRIMYNLINKNIILIILHYIYNNYEKDGIFE